MSQKVNKVDIYLLHSLPIKKADQILDKVSASDFLIEFLNPEELGGDWENVNFLKIEKDEEITRQLDLLDNVLTVHKPKGFFSAFLDFRISATGDDLQLALKENKKIIQLAQKFWDYNALKEQYQISLDKKNQKNLQQSFNELGGDIAEVNTKISELLEERDKQGLIESISEVEQIQNKEENLEAQKSAKILEKMSEIKEEMKKDNIDPEVLDKKTYKKFVYLYTALEMEERNLKQNIFLTKPESKNGFAFVAVLKKSAKKLEKILDEEGVIFEKSDWNRDVVNWKNKGGLKAFQDVAEAVGSIKKKELDPTIIVSIFFMLFFAFCLGDALYGILIALFTGYFLFSGKKLKPSIRGFFNLFFYCSLATLTFGILTNTWAGNMFSQFSNIFPGVNEALKSVALIDIGLGGESGGPTPLINQILPSEGAFGNPIVFMLVLAAGIGLLHIIIGLFLNAFNSQKDGTMKEFLKNLSWPIFVVSIVSYLVISNIAPDYKLIPGTLAIGSWLGTVIFSSKKNLFGKIFGGFGKLYGMVSVGADSVSYMRLAATGLSSSIIALVVNVLAFTFTKDGGFGLFLGVGILFVGHIFNLVVSTFGAYINPLRLHYVEFMPKFYKGEGRKFSSQNSELKYLKLVG